MNLQDVKNAIQFTHPRATDEEIQAAFESIDSDSLMGSESNRWTFKIWDRTTSINGVPAADVISKRDDIHETGDIVLISVDGNIVMFQPHDPNQPGFAPIVDGITTGRQMVIKAVKESVDSQILQLVISSIDNARN
jgi:hypothetical protein